MEESLAASRTAQEELEQEHQRKISVIEEKAEEALQAATSQHEQVRAQLTSQANDHRAEIQSLQQRVAVLGQQHLSSSEEHDRALGELKKALHSTELELRQRTQELEDLQRSSDAVLVDKENQI